jgi:hypothetical protein
MYSTKAQGSSWTAVLVHLLSYAVYNTSSLWESKSSSIHRNQAYEAEI